MSDVIIIEPIIQADESLIINGEFGEGTDHWVKGPTNPSNIATGAAGYFDPDEGITEIRYLIASDGASVSQVLRAPKAASADTRYVLGYLHETYSTAAGTLLVEVLRTGEKIELTLEPTHPQLGDGQPAGLEDAQPLDFQPIKTERELPRTLVAGDEIRVSIFSPAQPAGGMRSKIHVARLRLRLHLPPLQLQQVMLDGTPRVADRPLYLCLGASASLQHELVLVPQTDSPWSGTAAALSLENNPQEAIVAIPPWGTDQSLSSGWQLDCPWIDDQQRPLLLLTLRNQYSADAYGISVSLGHHRLVVQDEQAAAYYPVVEYQEQVRLGVQVVSFYTGQSMRDSKVTWRIGGEPIDEPVVTNEDGWAYVDFRPTTAGLHVIEATVESLYYASGVVTHQLSVQALATDPWRDVRVVTEAGATPWAEKTGYPNRGSTYLVTLQLLADSPLIGTGLALQWAGVSADELGVRVQPALEQPVPVTDTQPQWSLACDDRLDGQFGLSLSCSRLLRRSLDKRMSLARNLVEIGEVRASNTSPVVDEQESVLLRIQVLHMIASGNGDPVVNALVDWEGPNGTVSTITGAGGWASVLDRPTEVRDYTVSAKVRAHAEMVPIVRPFDVTPVASSPWKGLVDFYLDDQPVELATVGLVCRRGGTHRFKVIPTPGSPVAGQPLGLTTDPDNNPGLTIGAPTAVGDGWEWPVSSSIGSSLSGLFYLTLTGAQLEPRSLLGRLLSFELADEVSAVLDQIRTTLGDGTLYPCLGALHRFSVLPNALSPLVGLNARLIWSGTPSEQLNATVIPALDQPQVFSDGGVQWQLDFTGSPRNGEFALALEVPQLTLTSAATTMRLGDNKLQIETLNTPVVDPIVGQAPAWVWAQVYSFFTRQPVAGVPVSWTVQGQPRAIETDADGWSGFDFEPQSAQRHDIEVAVRSLYDNHEVRQSTAVTALPSDPWQDLLISFDGLAPVAWGEKTYFPRRKGRHFFELSARADSPLFGRALTLGMIDTGPGALGITFSQGAPGESRDFSGPGLQYEFAVGDQRDGSFALRFAASKLARLSPTNAMSQGPGSQAVSFRISGHAEQTLDWGQVLEEQVTVVSSISGRPMAGIEVIWRSPELGEVTTVTDFYGVARLRFKPRVPGITPLTATAGDALYSESVSLPFSLYEPREIQSLVYDELPGYPGQLVSATATVVSAFNSDPLAGVEVMWKYQSASLTPTLTDAQGKTSVQFRLGMPGENILEALVRGGLGGWDMDVSAFTVLQDSLRFEDLIFAKPNYLGESVSARGKVVYDRNSVPAPDVLVNWSFAQLQLSSSLTNAEGQAPVEFKPPLAGTFGLVAAIDGNPSIEMEKEITVLKPPRMMSRFQGGGGYPSGASALIQFRVISLETGEPIENVEIFWVRADVEDSTRSGVDGWVRRSYSLGSDAAGYIRVRVYIKDSAGGIADEQHVTMQFFSGSLSL
ncbi:hypothetical protein [Pseudomonas sp. dw_612]|uniref:Ig-like domain-containing protein n=1 Tax=Pseudomonas sp. dw_612 TaxID=2720080 RepID=UPI001BD32D5D|nr:hypothetical protein [Pseudomonas sp. dw_612]